MRRLVPGELGPTGGPAFTDVLGVCTSWSDGVCVVEPVTGDSVAIPLDLIVSGKPVPPRASPRLRVSVRDAELRTAGLFPGVEVEPIGEWRLRWEPVPVGRLRKRGNSCLAVGDPGLPVTEAAERVRAFYTTRGRRGLAQVELGSRLEAELRGLGWSPVAPGDSHFMLASLARVRRALGDRGPADRPGESEEPRIQVDGARVTVTLGEVARGAAGIEGDWLGIHDVVVEPAYRRRGLARRVLSALLDWGAERGATTVWLHVQTDNEPAMTLYDGLGFTVHHSCRYLEAPAG